MFYIYELRQLLHLIMEECSDPAPVSFLYISSSQFLLITIQIFSNLLYYIVRILYQHQCKFCGAKMAELNKAKTNDLNLCMKKRPKLSLTLVIQYMCQFVAGGK